MNSEIIKLFHKYINEQCSSEELEEVLTILKNGDYTKEWAIAISDDEADILKSEYVGDLNDRELEQLYAGIRRRITFANNPQPLQLHKRISLWAKLTVSAAIVLIIGGLFLYQQNGGDQLSRDVINNNIIPGKNSAVLTLANGKTIDLSGTKSGIIVNASKLTYDDGTEVKSGDSQGSFGIASVTTPRGGTYQVVLPDGTRVWLNAASSLKFPSAFVNPGHRKVQLSGEAYFEVAKDKAHPFIVQTGKQEVEVLGTHFNINAYSDEDKTKTTLLEGSVRVSLAGDIEAKETPDASVILKPGQQSVLADGPIKINHADIEEAMAWKNGYFKFKSEPLSSIMRQLSRWYDVEVVYEGKMNKDHFGGTISKYKSAADVLEMLESTKLVKFKVEGRKIIVK